MLRFNPIDDDPGRGAADGRRRHARTRCPTATSPNGPNLFNGTEGNGSQAKPEIYAMGLRNPSRLSIDPETDIPYTAWVGPDAGAPSGDRRARRRTRTPRRSPQAGNYGWPYCMGNQQAYRDRVADGSLRTDQRRRLRHRRPGRRRRRRAGTTATTSSTTRRTTPASTVLPHTTGTGKDAGTARADQPLVQPRQPGRRQRLPGRSRARAAPTPRRTTARTPTQLCPYLTASGATVLHGPVYRYDDDGDGQLARAGPSTGTAAGSCTTTATTAPSTRCCWTRRPTRTAPSRSTPTASAASLDWGGELHGLEVRPRRRALRAGLRRASSAPAPNAGIYRFDYTGGADTPGADPQWVADRRRRAGPASRSAAPAASSYEWDFGDGSTTSTEAEPDAHLRRRPARYTAKLTVTYADGSDGLEDDRRRRARARPTTTAPTTTAQLDPGRPRPAAPTAAGQGHADRDRRRRRHRRRRDRVPRRRRRLARTTRRPFTPSAAAARTPSSTARATARATSRRPSRSRSRSRCSRTARRTSTTSSTAPTLDAKWTCCAPMPAALAVADGAAARWRSAPAT